MFTRKPEYRGNLTDACYPDKSLCEHERYVRYKGRKYSRELTFEDMGCNICPRLAHMKLEVDRWKSRAAALENAMRTDCFYCDGVACRYSCGCINGNAWNFKEDANDKR